MFEEVGSVDIDADEFKNLPSEIQHEILIEMKDSYRRRYNRRKTQEMPEEARSFSDFQLKNLFRRGKITKKIDDIRKEMKTKSSGNIAELEEENLLRKRIETFEANRIASEDRHHYILLKKEEKRGGNVLFNSQLETNTLEIYEGVKRNENFDRLEREPLQFNSSSVDQSKMITFMSDSMEESDFDEEFSACDARKLTASQTENIKVRNENFKNQKQTMVTSELSSKMVEKGRRKVDKNDEVTSSGSEISSGLEDLSVAGEDKVFIIKEDENPIEVSGINEPSSKLGMDAHREMKRPNSSIQSISQNESKVENDVPMTTDTINTSCDITDNNTPHSSRNSDGMVYGKISPGFIRVGEVVLTDSKEAAKDKESNDEDNSSRELEELSAVETEAGLLFGKSKFNNEKPSSPMEILASDDEDVSAVPKPDVKLDKEVVEADNDDLKEFENVVRDCKSAEELSSLRETLVSEQNDLLKERERQSRAAASVGSDEYNDVQELLRLFGIPFIISPMEAEAQCAVLDLSNQTHGSITDDSDILLFGGKRIYKNIFNQDKYAELYTIESINHTLFLDREKMIALAYLTGSDYTEGIQGVGVITAMEILQEFGGGSMQALINLQKWYEEAKGKDELHVFENESKLKAKLRLLDLPRTFPNHKVWEAYINPAADYSDEPFEWGKPDLDAIREFAHHKFGWRSSRTDEMILPMIKRLSSNQTQTTLNRYFTEAFDTGKRRVSSKRLQRTVNLMRSGISGSEHHEPQIPSDKKKQRLSTPLQMADTATVSNKSTDTTRNMSYKNRRMPSTRDFQIRIAKSKASTRGRGKRYMRKMKTGNTQEPIRKKISSHKVDLSESSSDSDD